MIARIEVEDLAPARAQLLHSTRYHVPTGRNLSVLIGAIGAVLIHALAIPGFIFGWGVPQHRTAQSLDPGSAGVTQTLPAEFLILLALPDAVKPSVNPIAGALRFYPQAQRIDVLNDLPLPRLVSIDGLDEVASDAQSAALSDGNAAELASLYGRYAGQIHARIERAWLRPRSSVTGGLFHCQVQINQDLNGAVQEILLTICNASDEWRRSLVTAINQASPLPAPPVSKVFSRSIALVFEAETYRSGASLDQYERDEHELVLTVPAHSVHGPAAAPSSGLVFR